MSKAKHTTIGKKGRYENEIEQRKAQEKNRNERNKLINKSAGWRIVTNQIFCWQVWSRMHRCGSCWTRWQYHDFFIGLNVFRSNRTDNIGKHRTWYKHWTGFSLQTCAISFWPGHSPWSLSGMCFPHRFYPTGRRCIKHMTAKFQSTRHFLSAQQCNDQEVAGTNFSANFI